MSELRIRRKNTSIFGKLVVVVNRNTHTHIHIYRCVCVCVCVFADFGNF